MILEELNNKKLLRIFEWFFYGDKTQIFEFEGGFSVHICSGQTELFKSYTELLKFLDEEELSKYFYTDNEYKKRTALEEYSWQVFGGVKEVYKKYSDIISIRCSDCIWFKHHKSIKRCANCWVLKHNEKCS